MGIHSIIVIKNKKNEYLQYFDNKWNSYLFLNCKLPNGEDSEAVKDKIKDTFNIDKENINIKLIGKKQHKKFSESSKTEKEYVHFFYKVDLDEELNNNNEFSLNGIDYKWLSYTDLMNNERIQKVNGDIVKFIAEYGI